MNGADVGRLHRALRQRARLTQEQLAQRAGVGRWKIVKLEAGRLAELRVGEVERCLVALDARLELRASYHGAAADRLLDERHAKLAAASVDLLRRYGWQTRVEVSFSEYGERGSIDVVGWQPRWHALAVQEIKSELGSVEGTLRPFDIKCRLVGRIVRDRFGWQAQVIGRMLVLPEDRTARRAVERHATVLGGALPAGSRELRRWLREPVGDIAGIWFLSDVGLGNGKRNPSAIRRVRSGAPRSTAGA